MLRLATELVPTTLALLGADQVSPFWAVLFYFVLILFGVAQQVRPLAHFAILTKQRRKSWRFPVDLRRLVRALEDYLSDLVRAGLVGQLLRYSASERGSQLPRPRVSRGWRC